jgi:hypothetical protein
VLIILRGCAQERKSGFLSGSAVQVRILILSIGKNGENDKNESRRIL